MKQQQHQQQYQQHQQQKQQELTQDQLSDVTGGQLEQETPPPVIIDNGTGYTRPGGK